MAETELAPELKLKAASLQPCLGISCARLHCADAVSVECSDTVIRTQHCKVQLYQLYWHWIVVSNSLHNIDMLTMSNLDSDC